MKVNIEELKVRSAKTDISMKAFKTKYGNQLENVTFGFYHGAVIILHGKKVVASCLFANRTIYGVSVVEEYRNNGICNILMKKCISVMKPIIKANGLERITLYSDNPVAQRIYRNLGFVEYNRYRDVINYELKI